jgi:hypothetical protein
MIQALVYVETDKYVLKAFSETFFSGKRLKQG